MKLKLTVLGVFAAVSQLAIAADAAPVVDISRAGASTASGQSIQDQIANLERRLSVQNKNQIKVQSQLDELQTEVDELRGVTELHTHQLTQILERQRELYQELDRRVNQALSSSNKSVPATIQAPVDQINTTPTVSLSENEAYDKAVNLVLKEKKYDEAIPEFRRFIQQYPQSNYIANANYWLGQLLFNKGNLAEAKQAFNVVVANYPDSSKRSDAMLKLATVEQKQNNVSQARTLFQQLISEYPDSSAARLAQSRLDSM